MFDEIRKVFFLLSYYHLFEKMILTVIKRLTNLVQSSIQNAS